MMVSVNSADISSLTPIINTKIGFFIFPSILRREDLLRIACTMTKKEYLIAILKAISIEVLPIAPDLLYLVENGQEDADMTNVLYAIFQKLAKESKDQ